MPATLPLRHTVISRSGPRTTVMMSPLPSVEPNRTTDAPVKPLVIAIRWLLRSATTPSPRAGPPAHASAANSASARQDRRLMSDPGGSPPGWGAERQVGGRAGRRPRAPRGRAGAQLLAAQARAE